MSWVTNIYLKWNSLLLMPSHSLGILFQCKPVCIACFVSFGKTSRCFPVSYHDFLDCTSFLSGLWPGLNWNCWECLYDIMNLSIKRMYLHFDTKLVLTSCIHVLWIIAGKGHWLKCPTLILIWLLLDLLPFLNYDHNYFLP